MNQEFKNFDMLMDTLKENLKNENYGISKTIVNTYCGMLPNVLNVLETKLKGWYSNNERNVLKSHLKDLKELNNGIINKGIPKLIGNGEFKSLYYLQYIQKEIQDFIKTLESVEPQHVYTGEQSSGKTRTLLDLSVKTGSLITQVKEDLRGTGKTTELIKKANELDATLIVGTHSIKNFVDTQAQEMGYKIDCRYINNLETLRGLRLKNNKFLVDDSTTNQIILELVNNGNEFVGGFNSLHLSVQQRDNTLDFLNNKLSDLYRDMEIAYRTMDTHQQNIISHKIGVLGEILVEIKNKK